MIISVNCFKIVWHITTAIVLTSAAVANNFSHIHDDDENNDEVIYPITELEPDLPNGVNIVMSLNDSAYKGIYLKDKFDIAGFAVGVQEYKLDPVNNIREGNYIYGIRSSGIHSNGYTLINKLLEDNNYLMLHNLP